MFINRPDALSEDKQKQSFAELIVAKHRNGPTNSGIQLRFDNKLAKFDNAFRNPDDIHKNETHHPGAKKP